MTTDPSRPPSPTEVPRSRPAEQEAAATGGTAAVVVTYNRKELLVKCLDSLLRQTEALDRIYVIDNASTDGTAEVIPDHARITYLRLEQNLGGAYGFSYGVRRALEGDHRHVWVMDDDCFAEENALAELLRWEGTSEALCGAVLARDGSYDLGHRRNFDPVTLVESPVTPGTYAQPCAPIDLFTFVGALIRTDAVRRAGLPVDNFFFMSDDSEYALRLKAGGVQTHLVPGSRIWHHGSLPQQAGRSPYNPRKHYYSLRNCLLVYRRYGTSRSWFAVRVLSFALHSYGGLVKRRNLNRRSALLTMQALLDGVLGRAYVKDFGQQT